MKRALGCGDSYQGIYQKGIDQKEVNKKRLGRDLAYHQEDLAIFHY